jgi:hypothetical protein
LLSKIKNQLELRTKELEKVIESKSSANSSISKQNLQKIEKELEESKSLYTYRSFNVDKTKKEEGFRTLEKFYLLRSEVLDKKTFEAELESSTIQLKNVK